jgi:hypothetical protein
MKKITTSICLLISLISINCIAQLAISAELMNSTKNFPEASIEKQQSIYNFFVKSHPSGKQMKSYYVNFKDPMFNFLNKEFISMIYSFNRPNSEANCYFTSHLANATVSLPERFMDLPEYTSRLEQYYTQVASSLALKEGDILRLKRTRGNMDVHSVVYLGLMNGYEGAHLVLTKNGPQDGPYLVMMLSDVIRWHPSSYIAGVYRKK